MLTLIAVLVAVPAVVLSAEHQAMVKIGVGDPFPAFRGELADGAPAETRQLLGKRATVVATPGTPDWMVQMMRSDLANDFAPKYGDKGVTFLSLSAGVESDAVTAIRVNSEKLTAALGVRPTPGVYVLDADGKIAWFDIEYTLSTHRELHAALNEMVGEDLGE